MRMLGKVTPSRHTRGMIDPNVLELLVCPVSGGKLTYNPQTEKLESPDAGVAFPIVDGIPHLIEEAAEPL